MREAAEQSHLSGSTREGEAEPFIDADEFDPDCAECLSHPALAGYWPTERLAIVVYHLALRREVNGGVELLETVQVWEKGACIAWRREKMRLDGQRQLREIERHKFLVSQKLGYDIGWEKAARDWIARYAAQWREWWERQPEARPSSTLIPEIPV